MKRKGPLILLSCGALVCFLVVYIAYTQTGGVGSREWLEILAVKRMVTATACYLVFASLVIGWALPCRPADSRKGEDVRVDRSGG